MHFTQLLTGKQNRLRHISRAKGRTTARLFFLSECPSQLLCGQSFVVRISPCSLQSDPLPAISRSHKNEDINHHCAILWTCFCYPVEQEKLLCECHTIQDVTETNTRQTQCVEKVIQTNGCETNDFSCSCSQPGMIKQLQPCLEFSCGTTALEGNVALSSKGFTMLT